ncbi:hypothetical protein HPB52_014073 [Rhipicephalus sanguineus]|uniref:OTU domain-containing protein n=1 Tax=Rhipicephalus sanguineus TaxID=34632 RepID=A0A9D4Q6P6_RHISA|nr:hypothetical protein HPB52_014073 [Rhipicephalus sanguineus]
MPGLGQEEGTQKMDEYLNSLGFWRKQIAGDGSCLFRVVSEHVMLCYMHGNHYDVIYSRQRLSAAAMCQSIVYETLYKTVFEFGDDVDLAVKKMLYDKTYFKHKKNMTFEQWKESVKFGTETNVLSEEEQATASDVVTALANRIPPFPFKVAKALDPTIYRNVEYDIWNEAEKVLFFTSP